MIDAATLRETWHAHADRLLLIARSFGDPAEDAVQEAFVALATEEVLPDDPLAWLVRVTRNRLLAWQRSGRRRSHREQVVGETLWLQPAGPRIETTIDAQLVTAALQQLASPEREVIVMHLWGELTFAAIAELIGCSRATAHRHYQRGLATLQQRCDPPRETKEQAGHNGRALLRQSSERRGFRGANDDTNAVPER